MDRRGFMGSILALGIAPAVVRYSSLMPIVVPGPLIVEPNAYEWAAYGAPINATDEQIIRLIEARMLAASQHFIENFSAELWGGK